MSEVSGFRCLCDTALGWQGSLCDDDVPDCAALPCAHGTCVEGAPGTGLFSCACEEGFAGDLCATNVDDCSPNPCANGGTCVDGVASHTCTCVGGFTGPDCGAVVTDCSDDPCAHGSCSDAEGISYACACEEGWGGDNCDANLDDCKPNPCKNGGTCVDGLAAFTCDCSTAVGWTGPTCDAWIDRCIAAPCQNGGTCEVTGPGTYACDCTAEFGGKDCAYPRTTTCVATYLLTLGNGSDDAYGWTGTNIRVRDTFLGLGDGTYGVGPGALTLRMASDTGPEPGPGPVAILYYELIQGVSQTVSGTTITTDVTAASPAFGQTGNTLPLAAGTLTLGTRPRIAWGSCTYPDGYDDTVTSFTSDVVGTGPGCLQPYHSVGNVTCTGSFCSAGGLDEGDNPQDSEWEQALNALVFNATMTTFRMEFTQVPNKTASRSYVAWEGVRTSLVCE